MWFHLGCQNFIAKKILKNDFCDVFVSDFIRIWHKTLSDKELMSISQRLNPLLEASVQKLREITLDSLKDVKTQKDIKEEDNKITLKLESDILGLKFRFQVSLNQGDGEMFFQEFTRPLLLLLKNAHNREKTLMRIIEDKDEEIAEHKRESGHVKSGFVTTKPFIEDEFNGHGSESVPLDLGSFLDRIKFLSTDKLCEIEKIQSVFEKEEEKCSQIEKYDQTLSASKDKNIIKKKYSKLCVTLDNQIVKRRQKNALKLSF